MPFDAPLYPVSLVLAGRRCVVIGGGRVATRKVAGLLAAEAAVTVVAPRISASIEAMDVTCVRRPYQPSDLEGARLVIAATDDAALNAAVFADCEAAGVWLNAADDPAACSFILPAVVRQGPVVVAVSTSGYSPALARWLKSHVDSEMGPEIAVLAGWISEARQTLLREGRSTESVDWRSALDWEMLALIKAGNTAQARERLQACLSSSSA